MKRPWVICHMVTSLDGKVTGDFLNTKEGIKTADVYYAVNREYQADAYACGRITMEGSFTGGWYPDLTEFSSIEDIDFGEDYIADNQTGFYAVAFDSHGRLGWQASCIKDEDPGYDGAHIIEVLLRDTSLPYLKYLRKIGVSYLFAGDTEMDLNLVLEKLYRHFGIKRLLLEGGSDLNASFLKAGLIDELSLTLAPVIGNADSKSLFAEGIFTAYQLKKVEKRENATVCLSYVRD